MEQESKQEAINKVVFDINNHLNGIQARLVDLKEILSLDEIKIGQVLKIADVYSYGNFFSNTIVITGLVGPKVYYDFLVDGRVVKSTWDYYSTVVKIILSAP